MLRHLSILTTIAALGATATTLAATPATGGYQRPSTALVEAVDRQNQVAPPTEFFDQGAQMQEFVSPDRKYLALISNQSFVPIEERAQTVWKTGNLNYSINPLTRRMGNYDNPARKVELLTIASGELRAVALPANARIGYPVWSRDGRHLAFPLYRNAPGEVWVVDTATARARQLTGAIVNSLAYPHLQWVDATTLMVAKIARTPTDDAQSSVPLEPDVAEFDASSTQSGFATPTVRVAPLRPHEREKVLAFMDSQYVTVDLQGKMRETGINGAGIFVQASPDGRFLLVDRLYDPLERAYGAPRRIDVIERDGKRLFTVLDRREPVTDGGFFNPDLVTPGRRQVLWHPQHPARLQWLVAIEDAAKKDTGVDELHVLDAPFTAQPRSVYRSDRRLQDVYWLPKDEFLAFENQVGTQRSRLAHVSVRSRDAKVTPLIEYAGQPEGAGIPRIPPFRDAAPLMRRNSYGQHVSAVSTDGRYAYTIDYFRSKLARLDLRSGRLEPLVENGSNAELFVDFVDDNARSALFFVSRPGQGNALIRRDLATGKDTIAYTFPRRNVLPESSRREIVTAKRTDGLPLGAKVHLPPGWTRDQGPLPALFWVYARRHETRDAYQQSFDSIISSPLNDEMNLLIDFRVMSVAGYALVEFNPPILPKQPGQSPYEAGWNEQMVESVRSMIQHLASEGIVDPKRLAVGGQSGGGYTTANLLAHSDLFRAGIACNGIYNRTLSPFGVALFEERSLWEVPKNYVEMSPLFHANQIQAPLLIIKGQDEEHPSIHPAESANLFGALKGLGKTARYVEFPLEGHSNIAYESVLHQLWEMERWLRMYIGEGWKPSET